MDPFISAIRFLTLLPVGNPATFSPERMVSFFPLVGLIVGLMLAVFDAVAGTVFSRAATSMLDVVFLVWITKALHLDGLGDTADGLYGNWPRERALEIMKDSHIGAMALVMVICLLGVKWAGLHDLTEKRALFLILIPAYARASTMFGFRFLPYGRPKGGTGHALFREPLEVKDFWGLAILVALSLLAGWRGVWLNLTFAAFIGIILGYYKRKMACITGDMLGAMTELAEGILFLAVAAGGAA